MSMDPRVALQTFPGDPLCGARVHVDALARGHDGMILDDNIRLKTKVLELERDNAALRSAMHHSGA